jgi:hypothetical protein
MSMYISDLIDDLPPFFRSKNPDTSFDDDPSCYWLASNRPLIAAANAFTLMALHRPYIFHHAPSRTEALKAGLNILRAQRQYFVYLQSQHYKLFGIVLNTFDALVIISAIYILYPKENQEFLSDSIQHFEWAMERFETISLRNDMARAALGVLRAIFVRLKKAIGPLRHQQTMPSPETQTPYQHGVTPYPAASLGSKSVTTEPRVLGSETSPQSSKMNPLESTTTSVGQISYASYPQSSTTTASSTPFAPTSASDGQSQSQPFNLDDLAPLQPMHDLLYNDLMGIDTVTEALVPMTAPDMTGIWNLNSGPDAVSQFEGGFADDSFWGLMNSWNG